MAHFGGGTGPVFEVQKVNFDDFWPFSRAKSPRFGKIGQNPDFRPKPGFGPKMGDLATSPWFLLGPGKVKKCGKITDF